MTIGYTIKCITCNTVLNVKIFLYDKKIDITKFFCPSCKKMICIRLGNTMQIDGGIEYIGNGVVVESFGVEDYFKDKDSLDTNDKAIVTTIQDHLPDFYLREKRSNVLLLDAESCNAQIYKISDIYSSITNAPLHSLNVIPYSVMNIWRDEDYGTDFIRKAENIGLKLSGVVGESAIASITDKIKQIFFLSDVPVEWIYWGGCPLSFAYDVCRLPVSNELFHRQYLEDLSKKNFHVSKNIIDKTLVLMCCPEDPNLKEADNKIIDAFKEIKFSNYKTCLTVLEFKDVLDLERPLFLIVDCHGNYDYDEDGDCYSYLQIGRERLKSEDIDALPYVPPLIFLSACNIRPPKKVDQCIADAFIRRGALAVTASYVELDVRQGVYTIFRLISNLKNASQMGVHSNWLSFVAHCIRTFLQQTAYSNKQHVFYKKNISDLKKDLKRLSEIDNANAEFYDSAIMDLEKIEQVAKQNATSYEVAIMELQKMYKIPPELYETYMMALKGLKQMGKLSVESYELKMKEMFNEVYSVQLYNIEQTLVCRSVYARKFYSEWKNLLKGDVEAEFLSYTNYGRMDLIPFDSYIEKRNNKMKTPSEFKENLYKETLKILSRMLSENEVIEKYDDNDLCWCGSGRKFKNCHGKKKN